MYRLKIRVHNFAIDESASCFIEFSNLVENQFNKRIKKFKCDNGREYINSGIKIKIKTITMSSLCT